MISEMAKPDIEIKYKEIFINNEFVPAKSGKTFSVINPANKQIIAEIAEGDKADVDAAVAAAKKAFARNSEWRKMDPSGRSKLIYKLADLMERDQDILATLESLEVGKPIGDAKQEVIGAINALRYYGEWCDKYSGETFQAPGNMVSMTRKEPVGVVGQIIPWNVPVLMLTWKWGPALAAGCTIVLKPAESTPLGALHVASLVKEAGFPPGVINVVPGYGHTAGAAISSHMDVNKVAFTGSVGVGKKIMEAAAASNLKRVTLELGGKSPLIVCEDFDVNTAAALCHNFICFNSGQICIAPSRVFVHESIHDAFVSKLVDQAKARKVGDPFESGVQQGPQVNEAIYKRVLSYIEVGKKEGAKLEVGGNPIGDKGYFIEPTVFTNVTDDMKIAKEEIFGPVQCVLKFKTMEEVIERANNTTYGLAAGILTNDINKAMNFANAVEAGSVWVNCYMAFAASAPFGGYKQSGIGRENGIYGLENYLETKTITMNINPVN
ncbi:unnamed protein product [Hermetia illucens]|uniref:Aldehyde dehydrogenase domain-containing protein n=1 Tax=Hermetia illucens TaxID=343691 RepID=A0A7R8V5T8_HERIL|nr:retinal dehydrogenase 1-like [Hermetia illucens]CAD7092577.1 unnamed protein product [Hermetia illucens]